MSHIRNNDNHLDPYKLVKEVSLITQAVAFVVRSIFKPAEAVRSDHVESQECHWGLPGAWFDSVAGCTKGASRDCEPDSEPLDGRSNVDTLAFR